MELLCLESVILQLYSALPCGITEKKVNSMCGICVQVSYIHVACLPGVARLKITAKRVFSTYCPHQRNSEELKLPSLQYGSFTRDKKTCDRGELSTANEGTRTKLIKMQISREDNRRANTCFVPKCIIGEKNT